MPKGVYVRTKSHNINNSKTRKRLFREGKLSVWNKGKHNLQIPWNKGKKYFLKHNKQFKKGNVPWNKGFIGWNNGHIVSQKTRDKISERMKGSKNPSKRLEVREKIRQARHKQRTKNKFTKPELKFCKIIRRHNLPYKYTGDGSFWIENINPDFVQTNGKKICIEVFGDYWHNLPKVAERDKKNLETLQKYGWQRIVFWEHELVKRNRYRQLLVSATEKYATSVREWEEKGRELLEKGFDYNLSDRHPQV